MYTYSIDRPTNNTDYRCGYTRIQLKFAKCTKKFRYISELEKTTEAKSSNPLHTSKPATQLTPWPQGWNTNWNTETSNCKPGNNVVITHNEVQDKQ